ncbi:MAG: 30S ribosomal protein S5 [Coxiella sp. (in: Bacteria)]|nr:MAG: 30S ribosomal protein S5 [Coxiella sp. (in: g-proteobacteria)]
MRGGDRKKRDEASDGITEKLVDVKRTSKTVKGGRKMGFSALVVAGDGQGRVGFGRGKALEVPVAIQKATEDARRSMVQIQLKGNTIQHTIKGRHGASKVLMIPAPEGTGIIAGSAMRAIFEVMGIENILAKCIGSSSPINVVRATVDGLVKMATPEYVAAKRGKTVEEILE